MESGFYCYVCDKPFKSGYSLSNHFRSKKHKDKVYFGVDSVVKKYINQFRSNIRKELGNESS